MCVIAQGLDWEMWMDGLRTKINGPTVGRISCCEQSTCSWPPVYRSTFCCVRWNRIGVIDGSSPLPLSIRTIPFCRRSRFYYRHRRSSLRPISVSRLFLLMSIIVTRAFHAYPVRLECNVPYMLLTTSVRTYQRRSREFLSMGRKHTTLFYHDSSAKLPQSSKQDISI